MATATARVTPVVTKIIDGDGHIYERDEDIIPYLRGKYPEDTLRTYYLFPTLDGWRRGLPPRGHRYDAAGWAQFMDAAGISASVLYPTLGLAFAYARDPDWAADLARAYNDYVYDHFLTRNARLKAVALLPVQAPRAAAAELRRAINELGMVGGLLPTPGLTLAMATPASTRSMRRRKPWGPCWLYMARHGSTASGSTSTTWGLTAARPSCWPIASAR